MVTGYNGVKFDDKGQNVLASSLITQMQGGQVRPGLAEGPGHGARSQLPYKGW